MGLLKNEIDAPLEGDVTGRFADYSPNANLELVLGSCAHVPFLAGVPRASIEAAARHPASTGCLR